MERIVCSILVLMLLVPASLAAAQDSDLPPGGGVKDPAYDGGAPYFSLAGLKTPENAAQVQRIVRALNSRNLAQEMMQAGIQPGRGAESITFIAKAHANEFKKQGFNYDDTLYLYFVMCVRKNMSYVQTAYTVGLTSLLEPGIFALGGPEYASSKAALLKAGVISDRTLQVLEKLPRE